MRSRLAQIAQMRRVAVRALAAYRLPAPRLRFVAHGENTTFRVRVAGPEGGEFLLRVHRPDRHGRGVDTVAAVSSELCWLEALRRDTALEVPEPVRTGDGALTVTVADEVPGPRVCSVLRWMDGRVEAGSPRPARFRRLGAAMARLHEHADQWTPPDGFTRIRWDADAFFGDSMIYGGVPAARCWELLPSPLRRRFEAVAETVRPVLSAVAAAPGGVGLIHADLHLETALFHRRGIQLIDFDDCGFGPRAYEFAVALWELRRRDDYGAFRQALLDGYDRRLPAGMEHLDDLIAAREVAFALWYVGTAQVNPAFQADLGETLAASQQFLDWLRGPT